MTYHYIITVQGVAGTFTTYGTYETATGRTRAQVFKELYDSAITRAQDGVPCSAIPACTFFSLEPDELIPAGITPATQTRKAPP